MSNYIVDGADLAAVADAIRAKTNVQGGGSQPLVFPDEFVSSIQNINNDKDTFWVEAQLDLQTLNVSNLSHSYADIFAAFQGGKNVKSKLYYNFGSVSQYATGDLRYVTMPEGTYVTFDGLMLANLGNGEALYYLSMTLNSNDSIQTRIRLISSTAI